MLLIVRRPKAVSNHEATDSGASSFETPLRGSSG
jgi:hypothetical protein